jgi:hypothetical protein
VQISRCTASASCVLSLASRRRGELTREMCNRPVSTSVAASPISPTPTNRRDMDRKVTRSSSVTTDLHEPWPINWHGLAHAFASPANSFRFSSYFLQLVTCREHIKFVHPWPPPRVSSPRRSSWRSCSAAPATPRAASRTTRLRRLRPPPCRSRLCPPCPRPPCHPCQQ